VEIWVRWEILDRIPVDRKEVWFSVVELVFHLLHSPALILVVGTKAPEVLVELKEVEVLRPLELVLLAPSAHC
jgi:hypothetical protein